MVKIKFFSVLLSGLVFLFSAAGAHAVNLKGEWQTPLGMKMKAEQVDNTFSLIVIDPRVPEEYLGLADLKGTIAGNTFSGENYYIADGCPNITDYNPASGTVSSRKIEFKTIGFEFDPDACAIVSKFETNSTYTKILTPEEKALDDYYQSLGTINEDFANRSGPVIDTSTATVISTSPVTESSEEYPVNVGTDTRPDPSTYIDYLGQTPNASVPSWGKEVGRISNFEGNLILHKTYQGQARDREPYKVGSIDIHYNVLHASDTFSFKGDGFIQYHGVDGSIKQFMTAGYAKQHGFGDQIKPGQAGLEIILKTADPLPAPVAPPGPVKQFFNWLGELLTPEPQPTPYGIVGVKG